MDNVRLPFVFDVKKRYVSPLLDVRNMNRGRDKGERKINGCDTRERAVVGCHSSDTSISGATTHMHVAISCWAHSRNTEKKIAKTIFRGKT